MSGPPFPQYGWARVASQLPVDPITGFPGLVWTQEVLEALAAATGSFFVGAFASNKLALADVRLRHLDSNGDGTGTFVSGQSWFDTTRDVLRTWNGSYAAGRPLTQAAAPTIYLRSTGSVADGDGLTALTAYDNTAAGFQQALEDIAMVREWSGWGATIDCMEDATFTVPDELEFGIGNRIAVECLDRGSWTEVLAQTATTAIVVDTMEDSGGGGATPGQHGRVVTIAGLGYGTNDHLDCMVQVMTGNLAGVYGWIVENDGDDLSFRLNSDVYTDDGGAGLAVGDEIRLIRPPTVFECASGIPMIKGQVFMRYPYLNTATFNLNGAGSELSVNWGVVNAPKSVGFSYLQGGHLGLTRSAMFGRVGPGAAGKVYLRGDQEPCVLHDFYLTGYEDASGLILRGRNCAIDHTGATNLWLSPNLNINTYTWAASPSGNYLALYHYANMKFANFNGGPRSGGGWEFPAIVGNVTSNVVENNSASLLPNFVVNMASCAVYCGANPANNCYSNGAQNTYDNPYGYEVFGTGNREIRLDVSLPWVGSAASPPDGELVGRQQVMAFDQATDELTYTGFEVPASYIPGTDLEFDFLYSSQDAGSGNDAEIGLETGLYRPGTDDLSADPPDNLYQDNGNLIEAVAVAGDLERSQRFTMSAAGAVDGINLAAGQRLGLMLWRDADDAGVDTLAGDFYVLPDSVRIFMVGV